VLSSSHINFISTHSTPPTDHAAPAAGPVSVAAHTLPDRSDNSPVRSDCSPRSGSAAALVVVAAVRILAADSVVVAHPTAVVVAVAAGPTADAAAVAAEQEVARRIADVPVEKQGCIASVARDYTGKNGWLEIEVDQRMIGRTRGVVVGVVGTHSREFRRRFVVVTCMAAGLELWSLDNEA
jgi:hypothetical protein